MIDARFVPVEKWPGQATVRRQKHPFKTNMTRLLDDLERELRHLQGQDIIIQAYLKRDDIRNDGWPRSGAAFSAPGVILSFRKKGGEEISFPCDTYTNYEGNLRAISLTLTALRAIDRYGVSRHAEQYKGWAKLPAAPGTMSYDDAVQFLLIHSGVKVERLDQLSAAYRDAARKLHPDGSPNGSDHQFILLQQAKVAIEKGFT